MKNISLLLMIFFATESFAHSDNSISECRHGKAPLLKNYPSIPLHSLGLTHPFKPNAKPAQALSNFKLGLKVLLLSATNDSKLEPTIDVAKKMMNSLGIPYEWKSLTLKGQRISEEALPLVENDVAKYYAVITTTGELAFKNAQGREESALNPQQWEALKNYEGQYSIRRLSLSTYPTEDIGVSAAPAIQEENKELSLNEGAKEFAQGVELSMSVPLKKMYAYPAKILDPKLATSFLQFKDKSTAGVICHFSDGREQMHMFFEQSPSKLASIVTSKLWLHWVTRGVFVGKERISLNVQIDDLFLKSKIYGGKGKVYRISPTDLTSYISFQNSLRQLSGNSSFRAEFAFNGYGIIEAGGYAKDPLFDKVQMYRNSFYWLTHTYRHPNLDSYNYNQTVEELTPNYATASELGVWGTSRYSKASMVTPAITGLMNGNVLKALHDEGILYVVGDISRPEITHPDPTRALRTTVATNGFAGELIIPRHPTNVYFDVSNPSEMTNQYNDLYRDYWGRDLSFEEIMDIEEEVTVGELLAYNGAPWMFHQANLRQFSNKGQKASLLSLWLKQAVAGVRRYSTLPIQNKKMDDLKNEYLNMENFEKCGFSATLNVKNGKPVDLEASSVESCHVSITGIKATGNDIQTESYGPVSNITFHVNGKRIISDIVR